MASLSGGECKTFEHAVRDQIPIYLPEGTLHITTEGEARSGTAYYLYDNGGNTQVELLGAPDNEWEGTLTNNPYIEPIAPPGVDVPCTICVEVLEAAPENQPPSASFTFSPSSPNTGDTINFDASESSDPDGTVTSYQWDFGDGSTGSGETISHSYSSEGTYIVTLTVTDDDGATDVTTATIGVSSVHPTPFANFTPSGIEVEVDTTITFSAGASYANEGSLTEYRWTFDDGAVRYGEQVTHSWSSSGTYTVTLTVTDSYGGTASESKTFTVITAENELPNADFDLSDNVVTVGTSVTTTDNSYDPDGHIVERKWTYRGTTKYGRSVTFTPSDTGNYPITLEVTDNDGGTADHVEYLNVNPVPNKEPTAAFGFSPIHPDAYEEVQFNDKSSDPDGTVESWSWNFGDGSTSNHRNPTHTYESEGTFRISLTVTDNDGATDTSTLDVTVTAETNVSEPEPAESTKGGNVVSEGNVDHEVRDEGGQWKGIDNILLFWDKPEFERFSLGWSCKVGIGPFSIDPCAILATPIEVVVNRIIDLMEWMGGTLIGIIINWALGLARDALDAVLTLPPPFEGFSDYLLDWIIYGEDEARQNLTDAFSDILEGETTRVLDELGISQEALESYVQSEMDKIEQQLPFDMDQPEQSLEASIAEYLEQQGLIGDELVDKIQNSIETYLGAEIWQEHRGVQASYIYSVSDTWLENHGLSPDNFPQNEIHLTSDIFSDYFTAAMKVNPDEYDFETWGVLETPWANRGTIDGVLGTHPEEYDVPHYKLELFYRRSLVNTIQRGQRAVINIRSFLMAQIPTLQPTWEEFQQEFTDVLRDMMETALEDMGWTTPPDLTEVEATVPEAIDAFQLLQEDLKDVEAVSPEDIADYKDELDPIIEALQKLESGE